MRRFAAVDQTQSREQSNVKSHSANQTPSHFDIKAAVTFPLEVYPLKIERFCSSSRFLQFLPQMVSNIKRSSILQENQPCWNLVRHPAQHAYRSLDSMDIFSCFTSAPRDAQVKSLIPGDARSYFSALCS